MGISLKLGLFVAVCWLVEIVKRIIKRGCDWLLERHNTHIKKEVYVCVLVDV